MLETPELIITNYKIVLPFFLLGAMISGVVIHIIINKVAKYRD